MTPNTKVFLIAEEETGQNPNGYPIREETRREVWAEKKGLTRSEFYAAQAAGIKVSGIFSVFRGVYRGEEVLEHKGERFRVIRAYPKSITEMELTCASEKADQYGEV